MPGERHPVDVVGDDLTRTYADGARRLALIVQTGLRRGLDPARAGGLEARRGDASIAYRERQLRAAVAVLDELKRSSSANAGTIAARAYGAGVLAVDRTALGDLAELAPRFGGIHAGAVEVLARNMDRSLSAAVDRAGDNVERVFARANALERGLPVRGGPAGAAGFIGRRVDDPWRRVGLDEVAGGLVTLDTRRQVSANMVRRLVNDGVGDALTGYVDRAGRRWSLDRYAEVVARTTTREAVSRATVNRMTEHGLDLVTISSHPHQADECTPYDGQTFSLDGATEGYEVLDELPPFHPNCVHVATPAAANLDEYLEELERSAAEVTAPPRSPGQRPPGPAAPAGAAPPFGPAARPTSSSSRAARDRLEAQRTRELIEADPGPEAGAELARNAALDKQARAVDRGRERYLKDALGDDLGHFVGLKWGREARVGERFIAGELTTDEVEELAYLEYRRKQERADLRADRERQAGFRSGSIPCFVCGRRKPRPAAVCDFCGDDPVTYGGDAREFNRAYGYDV